MLISSFGRGVHSKLVSSLRRGVCNRFPVSSAIPVSSLGRGVRRWFPGSSGIPVPSLGRLRGIHHWCPGSSGMGKYLTMTISRSSYSQSRKFCRCAGSFFYYLHRYFIRISRPRLTLFSDSFTGSIHYL